MKYYLAPMEGLTGHIFRQCHRTWYQPMDKYFSPFISPGRENSMKNREKKDILPINNENIYLVPQILTNQSGLFCGLAKELEDLGYLELNLNLGCPSPTVTSKRKGAGFLAAPEELDRFLEEIFEGCPKGQKISVKTRLGIEREEEFEKILQIYNRYPLHELILHPRVLKDYYQNKPRMEMVQMAAEVCCHPLVYNGDLFNKEQIHDLQKRFPNIQGIMLGRGLIANPGLREEAEGKTPDKKRFQQFHQNLYETFKNDLSGDRNLLFRMKEYWFYMIHSFSAGEKYVKKLKKVQHSLEYEALVASLFRDSEMTTDKGFCPPKK
ncbi:MAG: tRNA-dihydrouridine synthase family protein [Clostridiales bacterium]|nr:tRNA-dihydrouridine synthase family protein [Clostridiales bacterium]